MNRRGPGPEDSPRPPPHSLARGGRVLKSRARSWPVATFLGDALWRIRGFVDTFRVILQYQNRPQNYNFPLPKTCIEGHTGLTVKPAKIQVLTNFVRHAYQKW